MLVQQSDKISPSTIEGQSMTGIGWEGGLLVAKAARIVQRRDKQVGTVAQELDPELELTCFAHSRLTGWRQL